MVTSQSLFRGMGNKVAVRPFDRVADMSRNLSGIELQFVDPDVDGLRRGGAADHPRRGQED
jgi:hypothetical protein